MAVVKSVEYVEVDLDSTTDNVLTNLTKGQDETQCTPFYSAYALGILTDQWQERLHRVTFENNGGTAAVRVQKTASEDPDDTRVGVFVVEWDSSITVQQVSVTTLTDGTASVNVSITDVGAQNTAFLMYSYDSINPPNSDDDFDNACVQCRFNGANTDSVTLSRRSSDGDLIGTLYVVECNSGEFTVDHREIDVTSSSATSGTDTISSTTEADTFLIHSFESSENSDDMRDGLWVADLQNSTTVRVRRGDASPSGQSATSTHSIAVVEAQASEWDVQRNDALADNAQTTTDSITSIDQTRSVAQLMFGYGCLTGGRNDSTIGGQTGSQMAQIEFSADNQITISKDGNNIGCVFSYEVIQFAESGTIASGAKSASGSGDLTAEGSADADGNLSTDGAGALTAEGAAEGTGLLSADGAGALTAEGAVLGDGAFSADGAGGLTAEGVAIAIESGALNSQGTGDLTAEGAALRGGAFSTDGVGDFTAEGEADATGAVSADGVGDITAEGASEATANFSADGVGDATAEGAATSEGVISSDGVGDLTAEGASLTVESGAFDSQGVGDLTAEGESDATGAVQSDGVADLLAEGASEATGAISSDGVATLTIVGSALADSAWSADGAGDLTVVGTSIGQAEGAFSMAGVSTVTLEGSATAVSALLAAGEAGLTMEGASEVFGAVSSDGTATMTVVGASLTISDGAVSMDGVAGVTLEGSSDAVAALSAAGTATLVMEAVSDSEGAFVSDGAGDMAMVGVGVGAPAAEEEEPAQTPKEGGGAIGRPSSYRRYRRRELEQEDEEILAIIHTLAPEIMKHYENRTLH